MPEPAPGPNTGRLPSSPKRPRISAGLLLYRGSESGPRGEVEVLLGHLGGPFWSRKDDGAWSIPKGEVEAGEDMLAAARREFEEELGHPPPDTARIDLGSVRQSSGKVVQIWALPGDFDPASLRPGLFTLEWPRGSGVLREFPELDRVAWWDLPTATDKLSGGQRPFLDRLRDAL